MNLVKEREELINFVKRQPRVFDFYPDNYVFRGEYIAPRGVVVACDQETFESIVFYAERYWPNMKVVLMPEDEYISRNQEEINYFDLLLYTDIKRNLSIGDYIELITSKLLNKLGFCGKETHLDCQWHKDIEIEEGKLLAETEKKIFNEFTKVKNLFERLDSLSILTLSSVDIFR